ncbi:MAG: xanthine dehydrogenase family protein molybdopterin-binding subunit [Ilumatobacter sp.]|uniref:xanthine dehydrogenase family protein molybdopterin-binding subunit n=1 Tax=Ilumatobacter sp. TaxID=1967498 RepID=UPI003C70C748
MKAADLDDWTDDDTDVVGSRVLRRDAADKATGRARYTSDIRLPGQLDGVIVRSSIPHGEVVSIDAAAALGIDGVVAVITADDVAGYHWYDDETPLLAGTVRFVGDDIALVVAETEGIARSGAAAIVVEYQTIEHATSLEAVLADGAPMLLGNDEIDVEEDGRGDVEAGFVDATAVVHGTYRTPIAVHNALESHGSVADWRGDGLTIYTSTQGVNDVREQMADHLGIQHADVRVVCEYMGGGFGAKQVPWKPTMLAALASKRLGAPVKVVNDRRAENLAAGKRSPTIQTVKIGADADGRLVAIDADLTDDLGAYSVGGEASMLAGAYLNLYRCANVRTRSRTVRTNTGPAVAFRAPGYVEATFVLESLMDELADRLGMDPIELRRVNHADRDQQQDVEWSNPTAILESYTAAADAAGWTSDDPSHGLAPRDGDARGIARGRGFAAHDWVGASAMPPGFATVEFNFDGSVHVGTSAQDIGTGTRTVLSQVAADEIGCDVGAIRLSLGDTSTGPPAPTSAGSTTVPTMAPAVRAAAAAAVTDLLAAAAGHLDAGVDQLDFDGTTVTSQLEHIDDQPLADLLQALSPRVVHGWGGREELAEGVSPRAQGSAIADVCVDTFTGDVRVTRVVVAPDCGRILNRQLADSQVIGGVTQGIGYALMERQIIDDRLGIVTNPDLDEYLIPTVSDTCEIVHAALDIADLRANPVGAKGIGELPLIPVPAAIANAVHDAIGVRFTQLPITRQAVLDALAERNGPS